MTTELTEWRPFSDFAELRHRLDQAFRDLTTGHSTAGPHRWTWSAVTMPWSCGQTYPESSPRTWRSRSRTTSSRSPASIAGRPGEKEHYMRRERRIGSFSRSMILPEGVTADDVEATTEEGVLEVTIPAPKAAEKQQVKVKLKSA